MLNQLDKIQVIDESFRIEHKRLSTLANACITNGHYERATEYADKANNVLTEWKAFMINPSEYDLDIVEDHR